MPKETKKQVFERFKKLCWEWIDRFNLHDLHWNFEMGDDEDALATYILHSTGRKVLITLSTAIFDFDGDELERELNNTAFHEVIEAGLLGLLRHSATHNSRGADDIDAETHRIINLLAKTFAVI